MALAGCNSPEGPEPGGPRPAFDGAAAFALVERQVQFGPRVPNTAPHADALAFFAEYLGMRADEVELHEFEHVSLQGDTLRLTNVLASFQPERSRRVLVAAHWDTRPVAERDADRERRDEPIPGANDGASGTAIVLTVADVLARSGVPADVGVDLVLFDGEDYGHDPRTFRTRVEDMFLGARAFVRDHSEYRARWGILVDLVGDAEARFPREGTSVEEAPQLVESIWDTAHALGFADRFPTDGVEFVADDHTFLNQAGIPTAAIVDPDYDAWHTLADDTSQVSAETLRIVGEVVLEMLFNRS